MAQKQPIFANLIKMKLNSTTQRSSEIINPVIVIKLCFQLQMPKNLLVLLFTGKQIENIQVKLLHSNHIYLHLYEGTTFPQEEFSFAEAAELVERKLKPRRRF